MRVLLNFQFTEYKHGHGASTRQHFYFKLKILMAVIALSLATKTCGVTSKAKLFQVPDILLKGTSAHRFSNKKVCLEDITIFLLFTCFPLDRSVLKSTKIYNVSKKDFQRVSGMYLNHFFIIAF